jgi:hypothetical protein
LGFFFFSVTLGEIEDSFHRPPGFGELLSSGSQFAGQSSSASVLAII